MRDSVPQNPFNEEDRLGAKGEDIFTLIVLTGGVIDNTLNLVSFENFLNHITDRESLVS